MSFTFLFGQHFFFNHLGLGSSFLLALYLLVLCHGAIAEVSFLLDILVKTVENLLELHVEALLLLHHVVHSLRLVVKLDICRGLLLFKD